MGAGKAGGTLDVTIVSATFVRSNDALDSYATVRCGKRQASTETARDQGSLPSWGKTFTFDVEEDDEEVLVEVFGVKPELDVLLGLARISIAKALLSDNEACLINLNGPKGDETGTLKVRFKWTPRMKPVDAYQPTAPSFPIEQAFSELGLVSGKAPAYSPPYPTSPPPPSGPYHEPYPSPQSYPPPASYPAGDYPPPKTSDYPPKMSDYPPKPSDYPPKPSDYPPLSKDPIYQPEGGTVSLHPPVAYPETASRGLGDTTDKGKNSNYGYGGGYPPQDPYGYPPQPGYGPPPPQGYPPAGYPTTPPPQGYPPASGSHGPQGYPPAAGTSDSRLGGHGLTGALAGAVLHGAQNMMHGGHQGGYGYGYPPAGGHGYGPPVGGHGYGPPVGGHGYGPPGYGHGHGHGYGGHHGKHGKKFKHGGGHYAVGGHGYYGGKHKGGKHKGGFFGKHKGFGKKWK